MLEFLLRVVGAALFGGAALQVPLAITDLDRSVPFPGVGRPASLDYSVLRNDLVALGLLLAVGLICFAAAGLLGCMTRLMAKVHDPYDDHPKMAPQTRVAY